MKQETLEDRVKILEDIVSGLLQIVDALVVDTETLAREIGSVDEMANNDLVLRLDARMVSQREASILNQRHQGD